jgi:hypothetical protein
MFFDMVKLLEALHFAPYSITLVMAKEGEMDLYHIFSITISTNQSKNDKRLG